MCSEEPWWAAWVRRTGQGWPPTGAGLSHRGDLASWQGHWLVRMGEDSKEEPSESPVMTFGRDKMYFWALFSFSVLIVNCNWLSLKRHWTCWGMITSTNERNYVTSKGHILDAPLDLRQDFSPSGTVSAAWRGVIWSRWGTVSSSLRTGWGCFALSCSSQEQRLLRRWPVPVRLLVAAQQQKSRREKWTLWAAPCSPWNTVSMSMQETCSAPALTRMPASLKGRELPFSKVVCKYITRRGKIGV